MWRLMWIALGFAGIVAIWLATRDDGTSSETSVFRYPETPAADLATCPSPHGAEPLRTRRGIAFNVREPRNYDPGRRHALLVVYAPAGSDRISNERFTQLTRAATGAGFIVGYVDHAPMALPVIDELGSIPALIAAHWCIDLLRVFLTGHSDGGTVATALALSATADRRIAGIAPSAAGFTAADLAAHRCPAPLAVLVMHGAGDLHFPGFGRQAAEWWARCNRCDVEAPQRTADGCVEYGACAAGGRTLYCEGDGGHLRWPARNATLIDVFAGISGRPL